MTDTVPPPQADPARAKRWPRIPLALLAILAVAAGLRVWAFQPFSIDHPDEAFQYLEQAHRLVFGNGIIPWEYRDGIRSWLVPLLLTLPMRLGEAISPGSALPLVLSHALFALFSLAPVVAAWSLGARRSQMHALLAASAVALWFETLYYSSHVLTELLAVDCFLPAAALIQRGGYAKRLAAGGALLALAALLRFQYGPAIAVFALVTLRFDWRAWQAVAIGGLAVLAISAWVDVAMGQLPFEWIANNIRENWIEGRAAHFGVSGPFAYFDMLWQRWGIAMPILGLLAASMWRRYPGLVLAAAINLLVHMGIAHKEYRFIWLSVQLTVMLAAIASAEWAQAGLARQGLGRRWRAAAAAGLMLAWVALSGLLLLVDKPRWDPWAAQTRAVGAAGRQPGLCGIATHQMGAWGYAFLRRNVPIYQPAGAGSDASRRNLARHAAAYNVIVAPENVFWEMPDGYHVAACEEDSAERICVFGRAGGCTPKGHEKVLLQQMLESNGY